MKAKSPPLTGDIYQLKITLREVEPPVWRRLEVPASITLARLHSAIQLAMSWQDYHLHEFQIGGLTYGQPDSEFDDDREVKDDRRTRLGRAAPAAGTTFTYLYDFGDGWEHEVIVEEIRAAQPRIRYPRVIDGERACPPEDVGSVSGYARFLEAIADPADEEHEQMLEWVGGEFDPEGFDVDAINREFDAIF